MTRRLLSIVPTLAGVTLLVFGFLHAVPGDPVEIMLGESASARDVAGMRAALGLDRPLPEQLAHFAGRLLHGDLGASIAFRAPVASVIGERLPATLLLACVALFLAMAWAIPLGVAAALRPGSVLDRTARLVSLVGVAVPTFVLGPLLVLVFSIALGMGGVLVRLTRSAMLDALSADHLRTARAKGAGRVRVAIVHALRTALPPVVTVIGLQAGALLAGAIVTETIFAWPGIGRLVVQAIGARDYPLVQGCVLTIGVAYVLVNLATDLLLTLLDPRMRDDG